MCGHRAYPWNTIETLRCSGESIFEGDDTTRSPSAISPAVGAMNPATRRSAVVFPQPDGPSRHTSCPCGISRVTSSRAVWLPYLLVRLRRMTDDNVPPMLRPAASATGDAVQSPLLRLT